MEWIKCSERLPKKGEKVGYTFDGENIRKEVYYPGFNGKWELENRMGWYEDVNITHWIPLPDAPKE